MQQQAKVNTELADKRIAFSCSTAICLFMATAVICRPDTATVQVIWWQSERGRPRLVLVKHQPRSSEWMCLTSRVLIYWLVHFFYATKIAADHGRFPASCRRTLRSFNSGQ